METMASASRFVCLCALLARLRRSKFVVSAPFAMVPGPWPFNKADDHSAQAAYILLGQLHPVEHIAEIPPHHRLLGLRTKKARALEFGLQILEKR